MTNTILDTLFLRKPRIEYQCPAICESTVSESGSSESVVTSSDFDVVLVEL